MHILIFLPFHCRLLKTQVNTQCFWGCCIGCRATSTACAAAKDFSLPGFSPPWHRQLRPTKTPREPKAGGLLLTSRSYSCVWSANCATSMCLAFITLTRMSWLHAYFEVITTENHRYAVPSSITWMKYQ